MTPTSITISNVQNHCHHRVCCFQVHMSEYENVNSSKLQYSNTHFQRPFHDKYFDLQTPSSTLLPLVHLCKQYHTVAILTVTSRKIFNFLLKQLTNKWKYKLHNTMAENTRRLPIFQNFPKPTIVVNAASKGISTNFHPRPSHKRCPCLQFVIYCLIDWLNLRIFKALEYASFKLKHFQGLWLNTFGE